MFKFNERKKMARRKVGIAIGLFAILAAVSVGYAASSGSFALSGVVARTFNMSVRFVNAHFSGAVRDGESVSISDDGHAINVVAQLMQPGDTRIVEFQIQNVGTQAARFLNISTTQDESSLTGLNIVWPDAAAATVGGEALTNYVLVPASISTTFYVHINWDAAATDAASGRWRYFSFVMDYQNAMAPCGEECLP